MFPKTVPEFNTKIPLAQKFDSTIQSWDIRIMEVIPKTNRIFYSNFLSLHFYCGLTE